MRIWTVGLGAAAFAVGSGVLLFGEITARASPSAAPCGLRLPPPKFGEPSFKVPVGGSFRKRPLGNGGFTCTLFRADGTRSALAYRDQYGHLLDVTFYRSSGRALVDESADFAAARSSRPFQVSCGSSAHRSITGRFWRRAFVWRLGRIPSGLAGPRVVHALRSAMSEWVNNVNWCRIPNRANVPVRYAGRTNGPGMRDDDLNVVDFGTMAGDEVCRGAVACAETWYVSGGQPLESDVRFSTAFRWVIGSRRGAFDIQSVAAHEFGHVLQFDHVSNSARKDFTSLLWPYVPQANLSGRRLGRGDAIGDNLYYRRK